MVTPGHRAVVMVTPDHRATIMVTVLHPPGHRVAVMVTALHPLFHLAVVVVHRAWCGVRDEVATITDSVTIDTDTLRRSPSLLPTTFP